MFGLIRKTLAFSTGTLFGVYLAQNLTGNLIANQAVYFFERELSSLLFLGECMC